MKFIFEGLDETKKQLYAKVASHIPFNTNKEYTISFNKGNEIKVSKCDDKINAMYIDDSQIGRCILNSALLIKDEVDGEINEASYFDAKGVMLDMSRAGVMTVEKVKEYIEYMSLLGLNSLMLYMEDTYEVDGYPYFGYLRGRYTKEELKEIDSYGVALNVEVIPCIQTLGHFEQYLKWNESEPIKDTTSVLMTEKEETYKFIEDLIKTVSECFTTKKIHIGMDEAWDLGLGRYLQQNGYKNGTELFINHIRKVNEIILKYGLEPMIWSDMYFRLASKTHEYYDMDVEISDRERDLLPDNIKVTYWDYYHEDRETYETMIKKHKKLTDRLVFAGGIWLWVGLVPDARLTHITTCAGLSVCRQEGIKDVYATCWGDDGCETDVMFTISGLILYGEYSYSEGINDERINKITELLTGVSYSDFIDMSKVLYPLGQDKVIIKQIIYSDPLLNQSEADIEDKSLVNIYNNLYEKYSKLADTASYLNYHFKYIATICKAAVMNIELAYDIRKGYDSNDKEFLANINFDSVIECHENLRNIHYNLWNSSYKPYGFENIDGRYGGKIARLKTAKMRINDFAEGRITDIPELKDKKLPFAGQRYRDNGYHSIRTAYQEWRA